MHKDLKQCIERLVADGLVVSVTRRKRAGHYVLGLANGRRFFCASSPSDHRTALNMVCEIRRIVHAQA